jgi:ARP2/3 complex 20 kDa subunit (ARPC4)
MLKHKLVDFIIQFMEEVDSEISEMKLFLNVRARYVAEGYLATVLSPNALPQLTVVYIIEIKFVLSNAKWTPCHIHLTIVSVLHILLNSAI